MDTQQEQRRKRQGRRIGAVRTALARELLRRHEGYAEAARALAISVDTLKAYAAGRRRVPFAVCAAIEALYGLDEAGAPRVPASSWPHCRA